MFKLGKTPSTVVGSLHTVIAGSNSNGGIDLSCERQMRLAKNRNYLVTIKWSD